MLKLTAIVSLILIATWSRADPRRLKKEDSSSRGSGSTMWATGLSCDSCGSECTSACGTRHFRSCCFNYLRRKRGPDSMKLLSTTAQDLKQQPEMAPKTDVAKSLPVFIIESVSNPDQWMTNMIASDYRPYPYDNTIENRLFNV